MTTPPNESEGFRLLDEFVCQAIPTQALAPSDPSMPRATRAQNAGIRVCAEVIWRPDPPAGQEES
jgi:hypothetical protein